MKSIENGSDSVAATIINNKIHFSEVCLSVPISLIGKFAFKLFHFYPNKCRLLGGTPLGGILGKPVGLSHLFEDGLD